MRLDCRILITAIMAAVLAGAPAAAQDGEAETGGIIGPPQLREFQLPGRTTTPAPEEQPAPAQSDPAPPQAPVIVLPTVPPPPVATTPTAAETEPRAQTRDQSAAVEAVPSEVATVDTDAPEAAPVVAAPVGQPPAEATTSSTARPEAEPAPPSGGGLPWLYILLGGVFLLALGAAALKIRSMRTGAEAEEAVPQPTSASTGQRTAAPLPQTAAPSVGTPAGRDAASSADGVVGIQIRPWLKLEFRPAQAAATLTEAVVQFELLVTNTGNAPARNVRIEARMFNAGVDQDREISEFFARPAVSQGRNRILAIPPRTAARVRSKVAMPKEHVREITVEGRRLFIPMVAITAVYEWGDGKTGQTSMSYLVGREPGTDSAKMGAFRLDLGPRVYRSVGQRPSNVAVLV